VVDVSGGIDSVSLCLLGVAMDRSRADEADEQFGSELDALSRRQVSHINL